MDQSAFTCPNCGIRHLESQEICSIYLNCFYTLHFKYYMKWQNSIHFLIRQILSYNLNLPKYFNIAVKHIIVTRNDFNENCKYISAFPA